MTTLTTARAAALVAACLWCDGRAAAQQVDPDFLRMWVAAQRERPAAVTSAARIAPAGEPGQRLDVHGQLLDSDGRTPRRGVIVFAYQTDASGVYNRPGADGWRLKAWARTDDDGRFTFSTIRPGPYPGRRIAAHIHIGIDDPAVQRQTLPEVLFEGDRDLSPSEIDASTRRGTFANIRPVVMRDGVQIVTIRYVLPGEFVF